MKKSTTHTFNVINIIEYHHSQGGGTVHADFSLLGRKWAESGILLYQVYLGLCSLTVTAEVIVMCVSHSVCRHSIVVTLPFHSKASEELKRYYRS